MRNWHHQVRVMQPLGVAPQRKGQDHKWSWRLYWTHQHHHQLLRRIQQLVRKGANGSRGSSEHPGAPTLGAQGIMPLEGKAFSSAMHSICGMDCSQMQAQRCLPHPRHLHALRITQSTPTQLRCKEAIGHCALLWRKWRTMRLTL